MSRTSRTSFSSSKGDSTEFETDFTLSDRLKVFKTSHFDPEAYVTSKCQAMNEKEIRHLCSYLVNLKKASAEEMRRSVYTNYSAFIRTSKQISDLEGELLVLKNLLSSQAALIHGLAAGVSTGTLSTGAERSTLEDVSSPGHAEPSDTETWLGEFLDTLEVLLAEKRVDEALAALDEGDAKARTSLTPTALSSLQCAIAEQRQKLADQLAETICQPSTRGAELRSSVLALKKLGDGIRAHALLLASHHQKLQCGIQDLSPVTGTSCVATYTTSLSQLMFSTIAQAASDSQALFGEEPAYASELVTWGVRQTEAFALLVKRHVLASAAAAGSLRAACESVQACMGHCYLLQDRGLALSQVLFKVFRPCVEQALGANLKRIEQSTAALAAADSWSLAYPPLGSHILSTTSLGNVIASQPKLSSSAHRFNTMVQEMLEDVGPLEMMHLSGRALEGLLQVFNAYMIVLVDALPGSIEEEDHPGGSRPKIVSPAQDDSQQVALLANALLLADELLPHAAAKLSTSHHAGRLEEPPRRAPDRQTRLPEHREFKRRLQRSVDQLRDSFCRHHALELIFTDGSDPRLTAETYLCAEEREDEEWFPSSVFQELFEKLTWMASIASNMFVGRERFVTILLMRLTETIILWVSDDQSFWEAIEEGPRTLGPLGLQQFYLDMEFVILFASQGRYLSRNLHQIMKNIMGRAIDAVASTGVDPYSLLPGDDWFVDTCEVVMKMLIESANFDNEGEYVGSPTASVSAKSSLLSR